MSGGKRHGKGIVVTTVGDTVLESFTNTPCHMVGGLAYLLQYAYVFTHTFRCTHMNTHTQACFPNLYLLSALFLTASFTHLLCIYTHLVFYLCQHILGPSTPCWALNSSVSLHGEPLRCACLHNTHTHTQAHTLVAGETHWHSHTNVNLSLSSCHPNISQCKYICAWKILFLLRVLGGGAVTQCPGGV